MGVVIDILSARRSGLAFVRETSRRIARAASSDELDALRRELDDPPPGADELEIAELDAQIARRTRALWKGAA